MALLAITRRARVRRGEEPTRAAAGAAPTVLIGVSKGTTTPPTGTTETHTSTLYPLVFNWSDGVLTKNRSDWHTGPDRRFIDYGTMSQSCNATNFPGPEGFALPELI